MDATAWSSLAIEINRKVVADYLLTLAPGVTCDAEQTLETLLHIEANQMRWSPDERDISDWLVANDVLETAGGREYAARTGPAFQAFVSWLRERIREAEAKVRADRSPVYPD